MVARAGVESTAAAGAMGLPEFLVVYVGGQLMYGTLLDYRVPRAADLPGRFECRFVEYAAGPGPFGA